jgi:hypothetical protein
MCPWSERVPPALNEQGQALAEFVLVLPLLILTVWGCLHVWLSEWNRARCANRAFAMAHARLLREDTVDHPEPSVSVELRCGGLREGVRMRKLENVEW